MKKISSKVVAIAVFTAIAAICCVVEPLLILLFGGVVYVGYKAIEYNKQQANEFMLTANMRRENNIRNVNVVAVRILGRLAKQLSIEVPKSISDVYCDENIVKQGLPFIRTKVRLKPDTVQDVGEFSAILRLINNAVYNSLCCGELDDVVIARSVNGKDPIIVAESVFYDDNYLVVDWAINDNNLMYFHLQNKLNNSSNNTNVIQAPSRNDEDF